MPRYSDELINEIFAQNDIIDYVSQYVRLKRNGRDYTGLCPFHKEKSPSFHVNQEKQLFHCFGCGAGGNIIQFVMKSEGLDFVEALKLMADRAGIILPEENSFTDDKKYQQKKRIYEMNKAAAKIYYECLTKDPSGKIGLEYFYERGITPKTITKYGLGYAPDSFDYLRKLLNNQGFSDGELLDAGLCVTKNDKIYDKFRGRVIFPIIDLRGNVIAFGGRIINSEERDGYKPPKYLNSSETPVFNKGNNLFSLNLAKKECKERCILCEGYMDVISVNQAGIESIVATLGTALTENQAKLLMKYTQEIILCYDNDEAGQNATKRAISIITSVGGRCRVMNLKGAKDPDEYIRNNGIDFFKKALKDALPATEYLIRQLRGKYSLDNPDGKVLFVQESAKILSQIPNDIEVDVYINKISTETEISKQAILSEIKKLKANDGKSYRNISTIKTVSEKREEKKNQAFPEAEKKLLSLIIDSKQCYIEAKESFLSSDFSSDLLRQLAEEIYSLHEKGEQIEPAILINKFSGDDANTVSKIFYNLETYGNEKNTVKQLISNIKLQRINYDIEQAIKENDTAKLKELLDLRLKLEGNKQKC